MSWLDNLKVGVKLIGGYLAVAVIVVIVAVLGYTNLQTLDDNLTAMYKDRLLPIEYIGNAAVALQKIRGDLYAYIVLPEELATIEQDIEDGVAEINKQMDLYRATHLVEEEKAGLAQFDKAWDAYQRTITDRIAQVKTGNEQAVIATMAQGGAAANARLAVSEAMDNLVHINSRIAGEMDKQGDITFATATNTMLVAGILGVLGAIVLGVVLSRSITTPLSKVVAMIQEMSLGHLGGRLRMTRTDEIGILARTMDMFAEALQNEVVGVMKKIAEGDLISEIRPRDNQDEIGPALMQMKTTLQGIVAELNTLTRSIAEGKLAARGDATKFKGSYRDVLQGVNSTLDAVIGPLNVTAEYVDRIAKGEMPHAITDTYYGDYNEIKNNINLLIGTLNAFIEEMNRMSREQNAGDLDAKIDVSRFGGFYRQMAQGVIDQVFEHIRIKKQIVEVARRYAEGDFTAKMERLPGKKAFIHETMDVVQTNLRQLVSEVNTLSSAAVDGQLSTRANVGQFKGDWAVLVKGLNDTLDAVVGPLSVATDFVEQMAKGVVPKPIANRYKGDFYTFTNNLNNLSDRLRQMLGTLNDAVGSLSTAAAEILSATTQQASGATEQSAAISQTTTTVDEVKTISEQATARAQEVANASQRTVDVSRAGQKAMQDTIESMAQIKERVEGISANILALSEQTQQIGEIIATVNEIAAQSNMLALNASVEAARAGEQGKGFAVVAMEVRSLAEQSKQATAQVKTILSEIQKATTSTVMATEEGTKGVDRGVQLANQARQALDQLSGVIGESAQIAVQLVAGGQQQASGVEQVALAMQNINQATIQSLASTRQAEKAAQNLNDLARKLTETISQYRL